MLQTLKEHDTFSVLIDPYVAKLIPLKEEELYYPAYPLTTYKKCTSMGPGKLHKWKNGQASKPNQIQASHLRSDIRKAAFYLSSN